MRQESHQWQSTRSFWCVIRMGTTLSSSPLGIDALKDQLSKFNKSFGFIEELKEGDINIVDDWTETTADGGSHSISNGRVDCKSNSTLNGTCRLQLNQVFSNANISMMNLSSSMFKKLVVEWNMKVGNIGNFDETKSIVGMTSTDVADRDTNGVCGFIVDGGVLKCLVDDGGVESLSGDIGGVVSDYNLYRIEMDTETRFYKNQTLIHTAPGTLTGGLEYFMIHAKNDTTANAYLSWFGLRIYFEEMD